MPARIPRWPLAAYTAIVVLSFPARALADPIAMPTWTLPVGVLGVMALGIAVECLIALSFGIKGRALLTVALMNLGSIPVANLAVVVLGALGTAFVFETGTPPWAFLVIIAVVELLVIVVETRILVPRLDHASWTVGRVVGLTVLMNAASFSAGYAVFQLRSLVW